MELCLSVDDEDVSIDCRDYSGIVDSDDEAVFFLERNNYASPFYPPAAFFCLLVFIISLWSYHT